MEKRIYTESLVLCILISLTWATPLQKKDSEEADSEEDPQKATTLNPLNENQIDQELANKASLFLSRYFTNHGTEIPLHIPTTSNHTIVITVVPNNASTSRSPHGEDLSVQSSQKIIQQQYQDILEQEIKEWQFRRQQEIQTPSHQPQPANLTPVKNLFGFVSRDKLSSVGSREKIDQPKLVTTTSTTEATSTITSPTVERLEVVIFEPDSPAERERAETFTTSTLPPTPPDLSALPTTSNSLIESGIIPEASISNNKEALKVPSNFGPVFIQPDYQTTAKPVVTDFVNFNTPAPLPSPLPAPPLPVQLQPEVVYLQPFIPPQSNLNSIDPASLVTQPRPKPQGAAAISAVSDIIGSLAHGNLGGVVQNSIKLAGVPDVQETAKLAAYGILSNAFQRLNPCNLIGGCGSRPAVLKKNDLS